MTILHSFSHPARQHQFKTIPLLLALATLGSPVVAQRTAGIENETIRTSVPPAKFPAPDLKAVAETVRAQTNQFRQAQNLPAVTSDSELQATAQYFAEFMAENDKYGHHADDRTPAERAKKHGYEYCIVSENIAYLHGSRQFSAEELAQEFVQGWKNSPEHRENMVDPDVKETGVAIASSGKSGQFYAVQLFGRPKSAAIQFEVVNEAGIEVHYTIRQKDFELGPRYTRIHELCRPSELKFRGQKSDGEPQQVLRPGPGAVLIVERNGEGTRIRQK